MVTKKPQPKEKRGYESIGSGTTLGRFAWINFLGGIFRGFGQFVGWTILVIVILWVISYTSFGKDVQYLLDQVRALRG